MVVRIEISRTYDDIVNYVICELEYDPYMVIRIRSFVEYVFFIFWKQEQFTLSTDDEMPQMLVVTWTINKLFLMAYQLLNIIWYIEYSPIIDLRLFGVTGDWKTAALDPGAWYNTVQEGGCRFMAAWVREEENASNQRQKKRDAEEADKVEVAPGVTVASLRRFRTALIGPTQGLPKRRRLCHK